MLQPLPPHFPRVQKICFDEAKQKKLLQIVTKIERRFAGIGLTLPERSSVCYVTVNSDVGRAKSAVYGGVRRHTVAIPIYLFTPTPTILAGVEGSRYEPLWYYVYHEMCHLQTVHKGHLDNGHGLEFYRTFAAVVPRRYHKYEMGYQPYNYKRYVIPLMS